MPKFVEMPHGIAFDIEQLLHYQVTYGDNWMQAYSSHSARVDLLLDEKQAEKEEAQWERMEPMKLILTFRGGEVLEIPDFEAMFLEKNFYPAIRELEGCEDE